jgi:hypothetical protein
LQFFPQLKKSGQNFSIIQELTEVAKSDQLVAEPEKVSDKTFCWKFEDQIRIEDPKTDEHLEWDLDSDS